ncbi:MAG: Xaa-Pro aminopeptidase, partial [Candidatus Azotimanducaceae bacterium]
LMEKLTPGVYEYQLEAELLHAFASEGARFPAYPSIVGSGNNACILHYIQNEDQVKKGDLVLVDAGCEYECYASDVTRTLPASGKFSKAQREVYGIVLSAQEAAINMIQPGNNWNQSHEAAVQVITAGLIDLGLLKGDRDELIASESYKKFYMHRTGHWLGLDVHDVGEYKIDDEWRILEEGMVVTVEPGIYILEELEGIPAKYRGIGIRIEDDVLVTKTGNEVLTSMIPKSIEDIEAKMNQVNKIKQGTQQKFAGATV